MAHWTPPNRGVTSALRTIPTGSSFPLMGTAMAHPGTGSTDGGTLVPRTGMAKSGDPTAGGKANRRNILAERGGPCGGIQVNRHYTGEASAEATTRNVYRLRSAFGAGPEFRSGAGRG
jgi:hypothetical protein